MSNLIFNNAAFINTDTYPACVKLQPATNYTDTIFRETNYTGQTQKNLKVVNSCVTAFTVPAFQVFSDSTLGGNFVATTLATNVPGNSTVDVPVAYSGTYKGSSNSPVYTVTLNGSTATYTLTVLAPNLPPTTDDKTFNLTNRQNMIITKGSLSYTDPQGPGTVDGVRFTGDVSRLYTDSGMSTLYVAGTELPMATFSLYYKAPEQDAVSTYQVQYNVKDNEGEWSI